MTRGKGKRLGRPRVVVNTAKVEKLRAEGLQWKQIAVLMNISVPTLIRAKPQADEWNASQPVR